MNDWWQKEVWIFIYKKSKLKDKIHINYKDYIYE